MFSFKRLLLLLIGLIIAIVGEVVGGLIIEHIKNRPSSPFPLPSPPPIDEIAVKNKLKTLESFARNENKKSFNNMPEVKIELVNSINVKSRLNDGNSYYIPGKRIIQFRKRYFFEASYNQLEQRVVHELTHAFCDFKGFPNEEHGTLWLCKAEQIGIDINNDNYKRDYGILNCPKNF